MSSVAPTRTDAFRDTLTAQLPGIDLAIADERHEVDGLLPIIAVAPSSEEQVASTLALAQAHGLSVMAHGGGRHVDIGNVPASYDVALDTLGLCQALDHEPDDMTVTVDAGVSLGDLQRTLGEHGQWLPVDPPCYPDATIGGILAVNAYGPARHAHGTLRDWVIGMRVAHPDGTVTKSGGRVVKNVSGYDMHKLHIGALGTLGIITRATFKLAPLPHESRTVAFAAPSAEAACGLVLRARDAGLALQRAEVLSPNTAREVLDVDGWSALMWVAGSSPAVERSLRDLCAFAAGGLREDVRHDAWLGWSDAMGPGRLSLRVSVLPSRVAGVLDELGALDTRPPLVSSTVTAGVIRMNVRATDNQLSTIDGVRRAAERADGSMVIDAAPPSIKAPIDVFGPARSDFEIMRRLKDQFDPHRTLAPGRFIGRL